MNCKGPVIALQVPSIMLLQGEEAAETVAAFMQYESSKQASSPVVAVLVRVNGYELIVDHGGDNRNGKLGSLRLDCPLHQCCHEIRHIFCLRRQVDQIAGCTILMAFWPSR